MTETAGAPSAPEPDEQVYEGRTYRARRVARMTRRYFRLGEGRISGYASLFLGALSVLAVLCFRYPEYLTTPELREGYDVDLLRAILKYAMWGALGFGLLAFILDKTDKRKAAYGVLLTLFAFGLGGYGIEGRAVAKTPIFAGLDWLVLDLFFSTAIFTFIEKIRPKYDNQAILRPGWRLDLTYFAMNHLLIGVLILVANGFAPAAFGWAVNDGVRAFVSGLPLYVQVPLLMVFADLVQYWVHRSFHEVPWLWKIHAVHHSVEHMDWLAGSRNHLAQTLVDRTLIMVPLYLLGPDKAALDFYVVVAALQAVFVHANVNVNFGPLRYVLATPQFHHWHHSSDEHAIDTNYAVHLPVLDMIFGSYHMPGDIWPEKYGTTKPVPSGFFAQHAYPFVADERAE